MTVLVSISEGVDSADPGVVTMLAAVPGLPTLNGERVAGATADRPAGE